MKTPAIEGKSSFLTENVQTVERIFRKLHHSPDKVPQIWYLKGPQWKSHIILRTLQWKPAAGKSSEGHRTFNYFLKIHSKWNGQPRTPGIWGKSAILKSEQKKKKKNLHKWWENKGTQKKQRHGRKKGNFFNHSIQYPQALCSCSPRMKYGYSIPAKKSSSPFLPTTEGPQTPGSPVSRLCSSNTGAGINFEQGTKTPYVMQCGKKKRTKGPISSLMTDKENRQI